MIEEHIAKLAGCTVEELPQKVWGKKCRINRDKARIIEETKALYKLVNPSKSVPNFDGGYEPEVKVPVSWAMGLIAFEGENGYRALNFIARIELLEG